jgi:hypothetical protein
MEENRVKPKGGLERRSCNELVAIAAEESQNDKPNDNNSKGGTQQKKDSDPGKENQYNILLFHY